MKTRWLMVGALFILLLAACSPAGENLNEPDAAGVATETAVGADVPALVTVTPDPANEEATMPADEEQEANMAGDSTATPHTDVADPVTVDLSELTPAPTVMGTPQEMPLPGGIDPVVDMTAAMRRDLATKLGIDLSEIAIVSVEEVTWRDSSLGCPQPGMGYMQVLTPGYLVVLEAQGETYDYHAAGPDNFILCENGQEPLSPAPEE